MAPVRTDSPFSARVGLVEIGERRLALRSLDCGECVAQTLVIDGTPFDDHTLVVTHQVWRGVTTASHSRLPQQRVYTGAGRALAVGTRDREHQSSRLQHPKTFANLTDPIQAHVDFFRMTALETLEPFRQAAFGHQGWPASSVRSVPASGAGCPVSMVSRPAMRSRISPRVTIMSSAPWASRNSLR